MRKLIPHHHYGHLMFVTYLILQLPLAWIPLGAAEPYLMHSSTVVIVVACLLHFRHEGTLCEKCFEQMPLNAHERAENLRNVLKYHHLIAGSIPRGLVYAALWLLVLAARIPFDRYTAPHALLSNLFAVMLLASLVSGRTHHKYYPWCPFCRRGRDDDDEHVEAPDPVVPQAA